MAVTVLDVIKETKDEVEIGDFSPVRLVEYINRGMLVVASGNFRQWQEVGEIFLRDLETVGTVAAVGSANNVSLPTDFNKGLVDCYSNTNERIIAITESLAQLGTIYPGLDYSRAISHVAVSGSTLYYQGKATETLAITYFKNPTTLTLTSSISELPDNHIVPILKNYILTQLPQRYRKKLEYNPQETLRQAVGDLWGAIGPYAERLVQINDAMGIYDDYIW